MKNYIKGNNRSTGERFRSTMPAISLGFSALPPATEQIEISNSLFTGNVKDASTDSPTRQIKGNVVSSFFKAICISK